MDAIEKELRVEWLVWLLACPAGCLAGLLDCSLDGWVADWITVWIAGWVDEYSASPLKRLLQCCDAF